MLGKAESKGVPRARGDGKHCDLCGCSFPAVRCDKCNSQIFCLSCDDMYHRHPKRRYHLRKAVDPTPTPQARPVLPVKISQLTTAPGDPSKMPLPPPRKKKTGKSFFDAFRRSSPSSENSPPLPKKEYSWTDRLGSIKKFMSNRPLPPVPPEMTPTSPSQSPTPGGKNDLTFILRRVDDKPPQLPQRMQQKSSIQHPFEDERRASDDENEMLSRGDEWTTEWNQNPSFNVSQKTHMVHPHSHLNGKVHGDSPEMGSVSARPRGKSFGGESQPFRDFNFAPPGMNQEDQRFGTLQKQPYHHDGNQHRNFSPSPERSSGMHLSTSATDLQALGNPSYRGSQFHNFPVNPMALHYPHPYPMYPQYPNYPQYMGNSWANLSSVPPSTDGDLSDHSAASNLSSKKPHPAHFGARAKRSQSVMYDNRMPYPPHMYPPFGGFPPPPGYNGNPWNPAEYQAESPSSPATSVRSFGRSGKSRRKKKQVASENDGDEEENDDRMSVSSSPRSKPKYPPSSDRSKKHKVFKRAEKSSSLSSTSENEAPLEPRKISPKFTNDSKKGRQHSDYARVEYRSKKPVYKGKPPSSSKLSNEDETRSPKFKKRGKVVASDDSSDPRKEGNLEKNRNNITPEDREAQAAVENEAMVFDDDPEAHQIGEDQACAGVLESKWECGHCTFLNPESEHICQVCCKSKPEPSSMMSDSLPDEPEEFEEAMDAPVAEEEPDDGRTTQGAAESTQEGKLFVEEGDADIRDESPGTDMTKLNSALDEAEKELSRGLMELMKLKEGASEYKSSNFRKTAPSPELKVEFPKNQEENAQSRRGTPQSSTVENRNQTPNHTKATSKSVGTDSADFPEVKHQPMNGNQEQHFGRSQGFAQRKRSFGEDVAQPSSSSSVENRNLRRDSSCQTQTEEGFPEPAESYPVSPFQPIERPDFQQYPYAQAESVQSPKMVHPAYRGFNGGGQGVMHRAHSRASLFGGRLTDARPAALDCDNMGYGFGPSQMYRSLSRSSLTGDSSDPWMPEMRPLRRPDFYLSMEELVERRRQENMRAQGLELVRMIREAEELGFTADDIQVALSNCGKQNPVDWLQTNWKNMVSTVVTLSTNYGRDKRENDIGVVSENESRDALRLHKGNIWGAVTECVEGRQRKFLELSARGNFSCREIVDALTKSEGNVEMAYAHLTTATLKPFLMRIWGAGEGVENQDGDFGDSSHASLARAMSLKHQSDDLNQSYESDENEYRSEQEMWDDDGEVEEEVSWNDEEEDEVENPESFDSFPDSENQSRQLDKESFLSNSITTPESDKSDYCDAFSPLSADGRYPISSSPVDEIFFITGGLDMEESKSKKKGTSFLSHLAALRKHKKEPELSPAQGEIAPESEFQTSEEKGKEQIQENNEASESKTYGPLDILKQTFSAIKDTVIGSTSKSDAKPTKSMLEARTIIVQNREGREIFPEENVITENKNVTESSGQPLLHSNLGDAKTEGRETSVGYSDIPEKIDTDTRDLMIRPDTQIPKRETSAFSKTEELSESDKITEQMTDPYAHGPKSIDAMNTTMTDKVSSTRDVPANEATPKPLKAEPQTALSTTIEKNDLSVSTEPVAISRTSPSAVEKTDIVTQSKVPDISDGEARIDEKSFDPYERNKATTPQTDIPTMSDRKVKPAIAQSSNADIELVELSKDSCHKQLHDNFSKVAPTDVCEGFGTQIKKENEESKRLKSKKITKKDSVSPASNSVDEVKVLESMTKDAKAVSELETNINTSKKSSVKYTKSKLKKSSRVSDQNEMAISDAAENSLKTSETAQENKGGIKESSPTPHAPNDDAPRSSKFPSKKAVTPIDDPSQAPDSLENEEKYLPSRSEHNATTGNEFQHMMSRIKEKMENCLEMLNTSVSEDAETVGKGNINLGNGIENITVSDVLVSKEVSLRNETDKIEESGISTQTGIPEVQVPIEEPSRVDASPNALEETVSDKLTTRDLKQEENVIKSEDAVKGVCNAENLGKRSPSEKLRNSDVSNQNANISKLTTDVNLEQGMGATSVVEKHPFEKDANVSQLAEYKVIPPEVDIVEERAIAPSPQRIKHEEEHNEPVIGEKEAVSVASEQTSHEEERIKADFANEGEIAVALPQTEEPSASHISEEETPLVTLQPESLTQIHSETEDGEKNFLQQTTHEEGHPEPSISGEASPVRTEEVPSESVLHLDLREQPVQSTSKGHEDSESYSPVHSSKEQAELGKPEKDANVPDRLDTQETLPREGNSREQPTSPIAKRTEISQSPEIEDGSKERFGLPSVSKDVVADADVKGLVTAQSDPPKTNIASFTSSTLEVAANDSIPNAHTKDRGVESSTNQPEMVAAAAAIEAAVSTSDAKEHSPSAEPSVPAAVPTQRRISATVDVLRLSFEGLRDSTQGPMSPIRPQSPFGRMSSLSARREAIAQERNKDFTKNVDQDAKPWLAQRNQTPSKTNFPKKSIKQQLEFERKVRKLVSEKKCRTYRKAETVVQLLEMNFSESEALQAAHECATLEQAISYLQQECLLCTGMYPVEQIVSMTHCPHKACKECIKAYFTIQIRDRTIMELLCPFCNEPDIRDEDVAQDYFNHLDIMLKKLVDFEIHELFQRKLRDRVLMKDPNFRWCSQCSSGFIAMPNLKRLMCPDCNAVTCANCRRPWEREHERMSCEDFATWKDANDPEAHTAGLAKLLIEDGIDCPSCHFRYTLAKGGCMHFRCIQCQHDFCSGCTRPFKMGKKCGISEFCAKLGLHAHHPRNCLFYLRDKDPEDLQKLLDLNDVLYDKDLPEGMEPSEECRVMEQKETREGMVDDVCGKEVMDGYAGLCRVHYVEYLGQLVNKHKIDPIQVFCNDDLELVLRRASKRLPPKGYREPEMKYREKLVQLITEELPLDTMEGS